MKEFNDISAFLRHMATIPAAVSLAEKTGLERAALLFERGAKAEIGHYQRQNTGSFAPWEELADSTKRDRVQQGYPENNPGLRSGEMLASIQHTVVHAPGAGSAIVGSDDDKLVWFELGTHGRRGMAGDLSGSQPPRSVLGIAGVREGKTAVTQIATRVSWALAGMRGRND